MKRPSEWKHIESYQYRLYFRINALFFPQFFFTNCIFVSVLVCMSRLVNTYKIHYLSYYHALVLYVHFQSPGTCYYLNSAVNPILYSVISARFRSALRRSICGGRDWARNKHSYNSNTIVRTRELSNSSTRRLQVSSRSGVGIHCGFEKMDMEVWRTVDGTATLVAGGGRHRGICRAQGHSRQTYL